MSASTYILIHTHKKFSSTNILHLALHDVISIIQPNWKYNATHQTIPTCIINHTSKCTNVHQQIWFLRSKSTNNYMDVNPPVTNFLTNSFAYPSTHQTYRWQLCGCKCTMHIILVTMLMSETRMAVRYGMIWYPMLLYGYGKVCKLPEQGVDPY